MEAPTVDQPWWTLDISGVRPLVDRIGATKNAPDWAEQILAATKVVEIDDRVRHLAGPFAGPQQMIGKPMLSYWPAESRSDVAQLIAWSVAGFPENSEKTIAVSSLFFDDARLTVWQSEDGSAPDILFVSVHGKLVDQRSLWSVRASEERYRNLAYHLPLAVLLVDSRSMLTIFDNLRHGGIADIAPHLVEEPELVMHSRDIVRVADANLKAAELFEVDDVSELIGSVDFVFQASPQTANRVIKGHFEGWRTLTEVMKIRTFKGRLRDVEFTVTYPTPPEWLDITFLSFEDITERLKTEAQLGQLQADYLRASRISTLGELSASIAHEINQPLSAIVTNAETNLRWLARSDPNLEKVAQLTTRIADSARHASDIVQRIRGMATASAPRHVALGLNEIVEEALLFVRHDIEMRAISLSVRLADELPLVCGDRVELQQVIVNLLVNAIQAVSGIEPSDGRIDLETGLRDGMVSFTIRDRGPGIMPEDIDRVFGSFFTTKEGGIGIGLSICQSIITAHGGSINAANHKDGGAMFCFQLPVMGEDSRSGSDVRRTLRTIV